MTSLQADDRGFTKSRSQLNSVCGRMLTGCLSGPTFVPMMEPTHFREFHHRAEFRGLNDPGLRSVLSQHDKRHLRKLSVHF